MSKKMLSLALALVMCLSLLLVTASAAEASLPDWYFLFVICKNVDADCDNGKGVVTHTTYSMTQEEIDTYRDNAKSFEAFMTGTGMMRAHVDVVEIDTVITELEDSSFGSYLSRAQTASLLDGRVDLGQYDHVTTIISLNVGTNYVGLGGFSYENGTGYSIINAKNWEYCQQHFVPGSTPWTMQVYVHEFLHFMENMTKKWGGKFNLHDIRINHYTPDTDNGKECYTAIMQNRAIGDAGTGVPSAVWQYPPHVLRTMTELDVPSGVTSIGNSAFKNNTTLTKVTIPGSVTSIEGYSFQNCTSLKDVSIFSGVASIGEWAFGCYETRGALERISIPASVASIGYAAFYNSSLTDVYYGGTEAQWEAIQMDEFNEKLTRATIHYNHLLADVKTTDYFAQPVAWALEKGITVGTGNGTFSPGQNCTVAQILTFLWRANGSPKPAGSNPFTDVKSGDYYADAAVWAYEKGIVSGTAFGGSTPCTRSMAVTYMWKAAGSPGAKAASFTDVSAEAEYAGAVAWAVEQGVTAGTSATTFSPDNVCTRGQIVTFLYRGLAK